MSRAHSHQDGPRGAPSRRHLAAAPVPAPPSRDEAWALVAPLRDRLVAVARERGLSSPDAQDVAHHVMCRTVERGGLDPVRAEATLLKAVVARCAELREEQERLERHLARTRADDRLVGGLDEAVCDRAHAHWLLGKLPARERRVITLSVDGETVTGIASRTGLSYPTVDRLLSRARKEMRRIGGPLVLAGAVAWRQRRVFLPSTATAAVAVAGVTVLSLHTLDPVRPPAARPDVVAAAPAARPAAAPARPAAARPARVVPPRVRRPVPAPGPVPPAPAAPVGGGREVALAPTGDRVRTGDEDLLTRLRKCLRNGAALQMGGRTGLVCEEELAVQAVPVAPAAADPLLCVYVARREVLHTHTRPFEVCVLAPGAGPRAA